VGELNEAIPQAGTPYIDYIPLYQWESWGKSFSGLGDNVGGAMLHKLHWTPPPGGSEGWWEVARLHASHCYIATSSPFNVYDLMQHADYELPPDVQSMYIINTPENIREDPESNEESGK
jgi:hypothetical protein